MLGPQHDVVEHMQALPHREVPAAIRTVQASTALPAVRLAFEFLVLTAARWGEVRWAEWAEIDRDGCVWTVPARRAKTNPRHRVPLCGRALEIIEAALAHVVRNRVEAAYARSDLFDRRRVLMDDWLRYLAQGIGCPRQLKKRQALIQPA